MAKRSKAAKPPFTLEECEPLFGTYTSSTGGTFVAMWQDGDFGLYRAPLTGPGQSKHLKCGHEFRRLLSYQAFTLAAVQLVLPVPAEPIAPRRVVAQPAVVAARPVEAPLLPVAVAQPVPPAAHLLDDFTVLDLEFAGSDLLEVAAIRYQNWKQVDELVSFVRFTGLVPGFVTQLTGITSLHVYNAPPEKAVLQKFKALAGDSLLVCHNISADKRILEAARTRQGAQAELPNPWLCTLALARRHAKTGLLPKAQKCGLGELCQHFKISARGAHRAKRDVQMCFDVLRKLHEQQAVTRADLHGAAQPGKSRKPTSASPGLFADAA